MKEQNIKIRPATTNDAARLLEIYSYYVENTAVTFEWEVPSLQEFKERIEKITKKYPYLVAETENKIVGYCYANTFRSRAAYCWNVETSIYVHNDNKKRGIGKALYSSLEKYLKEMNIVNMNACITYPQNEDKYLTKNSFFFHQKMGFTLVGQFSKCGYKFNKWYNMIWMEKLIGAHLENQPDVIPFPKIASKILIN